jgi:hypothetical protein
LHAVGKLVGGQYFSYALRGDGQPATRVVEAARQRAAIDALLATLTPEVLRLPDELLQLIPARPPGFPETREMFPANTGPTFDPLGPARSAAALTLAVLLEPTRAARMNSAYALEPNLPAFDELLEALLAASWLSDRQTGFEGALQRVVEDGVLSHLMRLATDRSVDAGVQASALAAVDRLDLLVRQRATGGADAASRAHDARAAAAIRRMRDDPASVADAAVPEAPPGSPIGM